MLLHDMQIEILFFLTNQCRLPYAPQPGVKPAAEVCGLLVCRPVLQSLSCPAGLGNQYCVEVPHRPGIERTNCRSRKGFHESALI